MRKRKPLVLGLLFALGMAGLYFVAWHAMGDEVRKAFASWVQARRAEGMTVTHGQVALSGFPGNFVLKVERPAAGRIETPTPWEWRGPSLTVTISPLNLDRVVIDAPGIHDFSLSDPEAALSHFSLQGDTIALELVGGKDGGVASLSLLTENAEFRDAMGRRWRGERSLLRVEKANTAPVPATSPSPISPKWRIEGEGWGLEIPETLEAPLGQRIAALAARLSLVGEVGQGIGIKDMLGKWSDSGGIIEVESLDISWSPLRLRMNGTLALDRDLQPVGAFSANAEGYAETVDALTMRGMVNPSDSTAVKLVLAALAKRPADGGAPVITMPVTVQDRVLGIGPARLLKLPEIVWK